MGEVGVMYKTFVGKPEGKRALGRLRVCGKIILERICGLDVSASG
jgi:hypothetical protein